jgi:hypothetical protein
MGLTLETMECFNPPHGMTVYKQNVASIGAKSCMGLIADNRVRVNEAENYYLQIFRIIQDMTAAHPAPVSLASHIFKAVESKFKPILLADYSETSRAAQAAYAAIIEAHGQGLSVDAAKQLQLQEIKNLATGGIQIHNMKRGLAFKHHHVTESTCLLNKKYLRLDAGHEEHYPALDWHVTEIDKTGKILVGNVLDPTQANLQSTQIPDDMHAAIMQNFPHTQTEKASWMMDLITVIKIITGKDIVTTRDILEVLRTNGIVNVIFVDGGCNEFRDQRSGESIACAECDPSLQLICAGCGLQASKHPLGGGMKNKKIKKTTKKKSRNVTTVRGRRMRKSYKRYKRSKTYKR